MGATGRTLHVQENSAGSGAGASGAWRTDARAGLRAGKPRMHRAGEPRRRLGLHLPSGRQDAAGSGPDPVDHAGRQPGRRRRRRGLRRGGQQAQRRQRPDRRGLVRDRDASGAERLSGQHHGPGALDRLGRRRLRRDRRGRRQRDRDAARSDGRDQGRPDLDLDRRRLGRGRLGPPEGADRGAARRASRMCAG